MLYLVRGKQGSGKTTKAREMLSQDLVDVHVETDMYFMDYGIYRFDHNKLQRAHEWCLETTKVFLNSGLRVVVSNTFSRAWEVSPYARLGYTTKVFECAGDYKSVHNVPDEVVKRLSDRYVSFEQLSKELSDGGLLIFKGI